MPFRTYDMLPSDELAKKVFAGEVVILRALDPLHRLIDWARNALEEAFAPHDPRDAENHMDVASFNRIMNGVAKQFREDPDVSALYQAMFEALGYEAETTFEDIRKLRRSPSNPDFWSWRVRALPAHRDGWATNMPHMINWWAPVYAVAPETSVLFYPDYWDHPIANDSANWDLDELMARIRAGNRGDYPLLPTVNAPLPDDLAHPLSIKPGEIVAFSGYHLHASGLNTTGQTRFNIETRTLALQDLRHEGAPNVDGKAPRLGVDLFRSLADETPLTPEHLQQGL